MGNQPNAGRKWWYEPEIDADWGNSKSCGRHKTHVVSGRSMRQAGIGMIELTYNLKIASHDGTPKL